MKENIRHLKKIALALAGMVFLTSCTTETEHEKMERLGFSDQTSLAMFSIAPDDINFALAAMDAAGETRQSLSHQGFRYFQHWYRQHEPGVAPLWQRLGFPNIETFRAFGLPQDQQYLLEERGETYQSLTARGFSSFFQWHDYYFYERLWDELGFPSYEAFVAFRGTGTFFIPNMIAAGVTGEELLARGFSTSEEWLAVYRWESLGFPDQATFDATHSSSINTMRREGITYDEIIASGYANPDEWSYSTLSAANRQTLAEAARIRQERQEAAEARQRAEQAREDEAALIQAIVGEVTEFRGDRLTPHPNHVRWVRDSQGRVFAEERTTGTYFLVQ